jgi:DNA-binding NtrC family response regulator
VPSDAQATTTGCQVLVIDDDEAIRELVTQVLLDEGYDVRAAGSGRAALSLLRHERATMMVLDLKMADMDGETFLGESHQVAGADIPVLLLSGVADLDGHAARLGADEALAKPFDLDDLVATVDRLLVG